MCSVGEELASVLRHVAGISKEQLTRSQCSGEARHALHSRVDDAVARMTVGRRLQLQGIHELVRGAEASWAYIHSGRKGVAALVSREDLDVPVVFKIVPSQPWCQRLWEPLRCVCKSDLQWRGDTDPRREHALHWFVSQLDTDGVSPHFLHSHAAKRITMAAPVTLKGIGDWLRGTAATAEPSVPETADCNESPIKSLSVNVLEFGGLDGYTFLQRIMRRCESGQVALVRGMLLQVLQGLAAMANEGSVFHNDLHLGNVLASSTALPHLHYMINPVRGGGDGGDGGTTPVEPPRVFKVPSYGILYRIIDFGLGSSPVVMGAPLDHAVMCRFFYGGPRWAAGIDVAFRKMPVELYDIARFCTVVALFTKTWKNYAAIMADLHELAEAAVRLGRQHTSSRTIKWVSSLPELVAGFDKGRLDKDMHVLQRACENKGLAVQLFCDLARAFGTEVTGTPCEAATTKDNTYEICVEV